MDIQSDAWLVEFERLQDVAVKEAERARDGHLSFVTFYTEQLAGLGVTGLPSLPAVQAEQSNPLQAITKSVAELADVAVKEAEQSDAWLVEFERLQAELLAHARKRTG